MRSGRKTWDWRAKGAVLAALVALFVQALLPAAALAAESLGARQVEICSEDGAKTVVVGADGQVRQKGFAGLPCHDCLGATLAFIAAPALAVGHVVYVMADIRHAAPKADAEPRARAPPRPPGQGPPPEHA
jgi:hypothetical protein